jgi:peptidoglycan/LPS O-acetylase OafA/YrhL
MIPGLDGLRGLSFLLIFLVHTDYINIGWVGVQLFFVLSGFLITGILVDMKRALPGGGYFLKFYGRRLLRIFPLYYFYLFLVLLISFGLYNLGALTRKMELFWQQLPYALTFILNFYNVVSKEPAMFLNHLWTISVEEQFYIIWPLLIFLVPEKSYKKLFLGAVAFGLLFRLGFTIAYQIYGFPWVYQDAAHGLYPITLSHMDAFGIGAFISQFKLPNSTKQFTILAILLPIIGFSAQYISTGSFGPVHALGYPYLLGNAYQYVWGYTLLNYFFAVTIDAVAREKMFLHFLTMRPLAYIGKISYGLYVYHLGTIFLIYRLLGPEINLSQPLKKFILMIIEFIVTFIIASLSYRFLEKPVLTLKNRYFPIPGEKSTV